MKATKKVTYVQGYDEDKLIINGKCYDELDTMTLGEVLRLLANEKMINLEIVEE